MVYELTQRDIDFLRLYFPSLKRVRKKNKNYIIGNVEFTGFLEGELHFLYGKSYDHRLLDRYYGNTTLIFASYKVLINLTPTYPEVKEIGGCIPDLVKRLCIQPESIHVNPDRTLCLCPIQHRSLLNKNGLCLEILFNDLIVPYFYGLSYYMKHKKWPLGEYSHGIIGLLEYYLESDEEVRRIIFKETYDNIKGYNISSNSLCICDSGNLFCLCHRSAFDGWQELIFNGKLSF